MRTFELALVALAIAALIGPGCVATSAAGFEQPVRADSTDAGGDSAPGTEQPPIPRPEDPDTDIPDDWFDDVPDEDGLVSPEEAREFVVAIFDLIDGKMFDPTLKEDARRNARRDALSWLEGKGQVSREEVAAAIGEAMQSIGLSHLHLLPPAIGRQLAELTSEPSGTEGPAAVSTDKKGSIGVLRVSSFIVPHITHAAVRAALKQLEGAEVLLLDLRGNGGGNRSAAIYLAQYFIGPGKIVLTSLNRVGTVQDSLYIQDGYMPDQDNQGGEAEARLGRMYGHIEWRTPRNAPIPSSRPVYLLVDGECSSACEIFAGALSHHGAGRILGSKTAGSVLGALAFRPPWKGYLLLVPVNATYAPDGQMYEGRGVTPHVYVPECDADRADPSGAGDPCLAAAIEVITGGQPETSQQEPTASDLPQATSLVVDGHTHQGLASVEGSIDSTGLSDIHSLGFEVAVQALPVDRSRTTDVIGRLSREVDEIRSMAREQGRFYLLEDMGGPPTARPKSEMGVLFGMEWFHPTFEADASRSFRLRDLGIRLFGPPDGDPDGLFRSGDRSDELSPFGRLVVRSLNEAGVLIDLTHLGHERKLAVIGASSAPTVITHAGPFHLPESVLRALAESGGQVWVSFNRNGLLDEGEDDSTGLSRLLDGIDVVVRHLGKDHVGVGTDYQADGRYVPVPLSRSGVIGRVRAGLLERGYTDTEVDGFLGRNVLRALSAADREIDRPRPWPALSGPYLGQSPPGMTAEMFAPGIISTEKSEINSVFSPDGKEFYFTTWEPETGTSILATRQVNGLWGPPKRTSFSTDASDVDPAISPDGQRLVFSSRRARPGETERRQGGFDMWFVEREGSEWGEARYLGSVVNSGTSQVYPSVTRDGALYFQAVRDRGYGKADIYRSQWLRGAYQKPENLGPAINSENYEGDVFIAPDESYLVVSAYGRDDDLGEGDLYIAFRTLDGEWSPLRNMGPAVNSEKREFCPMVSPDGKFLFFTSKRNGEGDIFWVDSGVIEGLRETSQQEHESH